MFKIKTEQKCCLHATQVRTSGFKKHEPWLNKNTLIKTRTEYWMYKNIKEIFAAAKRATYKKKVKPKQGRKLI